MAPVVEDEPASWLGTTSCHHVVLYATKEYPIDAQHAYIYIQANACATQYYTVYPGIPHTHTQHTLIYTFIHTLTHTLTHTTHTLHTLIHTFIHTHDTPTHTHSNIVVSS